MLTLPQNLSEFSRVLGWEYSSQPERRHSRHESN